MIPRSDPSPPLMAAMMDPIGLTELVPHWLATTRVLPQSDPEPFRLGDRLRCDGLFVRPNRILRRMARSPEPRNDEAQFPGHWNYLVSRFRMYRRVPDLAFVTN